MSFLRVKKTWDTCQLKGRQYVSFISSNNRWVIFFGIIGCCCCCFVVAFISSENKNKCSPKTDLKFLRDELSHDVRAPGAPLYLVALLGRRFMRMTMMTATMPMMTITRTPTTAPTMTFMELLGASAVKESWEMQQKMCLLSGGPVSYPLRYLQNRYR